MRTGIRETHSERYVTFDHRKTAISASTKIRETVQKIQEEGFQLLSLVNARTPPPPLES